MDPYVYPGTTVLKNLRDIRDRDLLSKFEMDMTTRRLAELAVRPGKNRLDPKHLQSIHRHIFQDIYTWAGDYRTVNISRSGDAFAFCEHIGSNLERICGELKAENFLAGSNLDRLAKRAAYYMGEINAIHPFRDGNGRTQREYIRQLALRNGFTLHWARITRDQMYDASVRSFKQCDYSGLEQILREAMS